MLIMHRINTIRALAAIPRKYGVEVDVRGYGERLLLSHEPISDAAACDSLEDYLGGFEHAFIVFDVKEAGYEERIIRLAKEQGITDYFLLDVEFPFLYKATRQMGFRNIAVRYSEAEPIESAEAQKKAGQALLDWVWIDTNTKLPLTADTVRRLKAFRTCLVSPDRWGRPEDIRKYAADMGRLGFQPDAVMTDIAHAREWEEYGAGL
jgi:hypothetical protein